MNRSDLSIVLHCTMTKWHWSLVNVEGECLETGSNSDYQTATTQALAAMDKHVNKRDTQ